MSWDRIPSNIPTGIFRMLYEEEPTEEEITKKELLKLVDKFLNYFKKMIIDGHQSPHVLGRLILI